MCQDNDGEHFKFNLDDASLSDAAYLFADGASALVDYIATIAGLSESAAQDIVMLYIKSALSLNERRKNRCCNQNLKD